MILMDGKSQLDNNRTVSTWLNIEDAPLNEMEDLINKGFSKDLIDYLKLEVIKESKKHGDFRYREVKILQKELKSFPEDFSKALNECQWSRLKDCFDACYYLLPKRVNNAIRLFYFLLPNEYTHLINEHLQPLWLFPLLEDPDRHSFNVKGLLPALQAVYASTLLEMVKTEKVKVSDIFEELEINLHRKDWIATSAQMLEELIRESFSDKNKSMKKKASGLKEEVLKWLAICFSEKKIANEEIEIFLLNLTGRVNRESWLGALNLANLLDDQVTESSKYNAKILRVNILEEYPSLWRKNNVEVSKNYFHGEMSIELINELANAFHKLKSNPISYLLYESGVDRPEKLWEYRNSHGYDQYLNNRILCFANVLVITFVIEKYLEEMGKLPIELDQYIKLFLSYIRQWKGHYINNGEDLILKELFARLGRLLQKSNQLLHFAPVIFSYFPIPNVTINLLKNIKRGSEDYLYLKQLTEESIKIHLAGMRQSNLIELVEISYEMSIWDLSVQLCEEIQFECIKDDNMQTYLAKIYASSVLNLIYQGNNLENKNNILNTAYENIDRIHQNLNYYTDRQFDVFFGYIIGEMTNNNLITSNNILINFLNETHSSNTPDEFSEVLSYVRSMLFIHLIGCNQALSSEYITELEFELESAKKLPNIEGIIYLMKAWIAERKAALNEKDFYLKQAKNYIDQIRQARDILPTPLLPLALYILEGDNYASRS
ncbi:hypothetical protein CN457_28830 [Bacillus cereus]|nr:hypothetical protein CN414_17160 [Bacillus cereus]PEX72463.1 hypothetical protein CN457_28830 [Bacillus cereus]PFA76513.1 hypothetical protein CN406_19670 [Bacillus cereus]PFM55372.1 hypothetical protein COJ49_08120 [Bacillus cereus]PGU80757.1 hypothetical protein COD68_23625 [Bacillus cereus]